MTQSISATQVVQLVLGLCAAMLVVCYADRLRVLHWRTHLWRVIGMHAAWAVWLGSIGFRAWTAGDVPLHNVLGLAGAALWLLVSAPTWRGGPPIYTQSGPAPLGPPEMGTDELGGAQAARATHASREVPR